MELLIEFLGTILETALITKIGILFLLFFIGLCGITGYLYLSC